MVLIKGLVPAGIGVSLMSVLVLDGLIMSKAFHDII